MELFYPYYDTALFQDGAGVRTLFTQPEGSETNKQSEDTNMRIGGQFASGATFTLEKISVFPDTALAEADVQDVWIQNFLKVIIENKNFLQVPLRQCADLSAFGGHFTQGTAGNRAIIGAEGNGFVLKKPIVIQGGVQFKVELHQITALSTTNQRVKCVLSGMYDDGQR